MALNFHRQLNGLQLVPQNTITPSVLGEMRYNSSTNKIELFNGIVDSIVTESSPSALSPVANNTIISNITGSTNIPVANSLSSILDSTLTTTQGSLIYRNASSWITLPPGTNGQLLSTSGASANPAWVTASGTGTVTQVNTGTGLTGGPITTTGSISLQNTAVTAGSYLAANITVDAQGRITAAANGSGSSPTGDPNTVAFFNGAGNIADQTNFSWTGTHLGILQTTPKAVIHADSTTTSGTVGTGAFVFGRINTTNNIGNGSVLFSSQGGGAGVSNSAIANDSLVAGTNNSILAGDRSAVFGTSNTINCSQGNNFILGTAGQILGTIGDEFIAGQSNTINVTGGNGGSAAFGGSNSITGTVASNSFVTGNSNSLTGDLSAGFGLGSIIQGYAQLVAGRYNLAQGTAGSWVSNDDLFILGNGVNNGSRSNAFKVTKDGSACIEKEVLNAVDTPVFTGSQQIDTANRTFIKMNSNGPVTLATPALTAGTREGQTVILYNNNTTPGFTISWANQAGDINNPAKATVTTNPGDIISYIWTTSGVGGWVCTSRSIN